MTQRIIVASAVLTNGSEVLLLRRSAHNKHFCGYWQLPEGKLELHESPAEALHRELLEELSITVASLKLIGTTVTVGTDAYLGVEVLRFVYQARLPASIVPTLSKEHITHLWTSSPTLPLYPGTQLILERWGPRALHPPVAHKSR